MNKEQRTVVYDEALKIEAYQFTGIMQKFPNHFHEYYVIGFMASGQRHLSCKNQEYVTCTGDFLLINPHDNHTCSQIDEEGMDWRCLNITKEVMAELLTEIKGYPYLPIFSQTVIPQSFLTPLLAELHQAMMEKEPVIRREELLYLLLEQLVDEYGQEPVHGIKISASLDKACCYMKEHYASQINLQTLGNIAGLNKFTLLRSFTREIGVTPYQYLETLRISQAKKLLETGMEPALAAIETGFSDQSHFTRFFKNIIGLTPKQYQNIFQKNGDL